eukprot:COSAG01_NODE_1917_length_8905_cov_13.409266_6_plen_76_part_01
MRPSCYMYLLQRPSPRAWPHAALGPTAAGDGRVASYGLPHGKSLCCNALHFKHCGVIYRLEPMPKYRHTIRLVVNV